MKTLLVVTVLTLLVAGSFGRIIPKDKKRAVEDAELSPAPFDLDLNRLPLNVAVQDTTPFVVLICSIQPTASPRVQWTEHAYNPNGVPITDNEFIFEGPNKPRYTVLKTAGQWAYDLEIRPVLISDGGLYVCMDTTGALKKQHGAQLSVISSTPNCTTTIKANGVVLDQSYVTNDCTWEYKGGLIPNVTWTGVGPFNQGSVATATHVWAGMGINITRAMDTMSHKCTLNFTGYFLPIGGDSAANIPTFSTIFQQRQMFVYWGPASITIQGQKPGDNYVTGDQLICTADAFPVPTYLWQNTRTGEIINSQLLVIPASWYGFNQTMRCEAKNTIEGTPYPYNQLINVNVPLLTTPPTTTPAPTTTPPPAVEPCPNLSGGWRSTFPTEASLCINLDLTNNAALKGLLKNGTDTYWVDLVGRAQINKYDQVGFNGIWSNGVVSSFVGECHRCYGKDYLLVNAVSRTKGTECGMSGQVSYTVQYDFERATIGQVC
jgi:hypothetical protein